VAALEAKSAHSECILLLFVIELDSERKIVKQNVSSRTNKLLAATFQTQTMLVLVSFMQDSKRLRMSVSSLNCASSCIA